MLRSRTNQLLLTIIVLVAACVLRIAVSFQPLWLDEIWSLMFAERTEHFWQIFTIHHLNNHPLNTLYLWFLGRDQWSVAYRIPALLCGITLLLWMTRDAWKRSRLEGFFTALLIGFALPVVQAATEARGYGPMLLAAYAAYYFFKRLEESGSRRDTGFYILSASLAVALHLSAITVILAAAASTFVRQYAMGAMDAFRATLRRHAVPFLAFGLLVVLTLGRQSFDVGQDPGVSFAVFGSYVLGWPGMTRSAATIASFTAVVAILAALETLLRKKPAEGVFLLVLLFLAPAALIFVGSRAIGLEVRFFLPGIAAFSVLLARGASTIFEHRSAALKSAGMAVLLPILAGHLRSDVRLLQYGRGESRGFPAVIAYMREHSEKRPITFGAEFSIDHVLVEYFGNALGESREFVFVRHPAGESDPPEWLLERRFAWEGMREDFRIRASERYEIMMPAEEGRWWIVWKKKNITAASPAPQRSAAIPDPSQTDH